jgi:hypothetical protein
MGGATGRIGDPSFKEKERELKTYDELDSNLAFQQEQVKKFLDFEGPNAAIIVNNFDFYKNMIVVSRGEYLTKLNSNIIVLDKNTLASIHEVPYNDIPYTTENIIIKNDIAYIAVNNGFEWGKEVGQIVELNLQKIQKT